MASWALQTAARTLWQEARGEPLAGQEAVAWVLRNRMFSGRWGHSLASVCLWHAQFSGWSSADPNFRLACEIDDDAPALNDLVNLINSIMSATPDADPTGGALFYFADSMAVPPSWSGSMHFCGQFGHQKFFTDRPPQNTAITA